MYRRHANTLEIDVTSIRTRQELHALLYEAFQVPGYYGKNWDAQIGVKNITNVTYYMFAESAGGYVGQPRTFYAKAAWHY